MTKTIECISNRAARVYLHVNGPERSHQAFALLLANESSRTATRLVFLMNIYYAFIYSKKLEGQINEAETRLCRGSSRKEH